MDNKPPIPLYKDAKNIKDLNHNLGLLIIAVNHNTTQMANDIRWIKRFVFGISGFMGLLLIGALSSLF